MPSMSWLAEYRRKTAALPRLALGTFPTPVRTASVEGRQFWTKDDGGCCRVYGGNKVRKLEYLLADAAYRGIRRLVVWGDSSSHTILAGALIGINAGVDVEAIVF